MDWEERRAKEEILGSWDLPYAMSEHGLDDLLSRTEKIVLELTGQNDGAEWHWIVTTTTGFAYIVGGCDYTGWDCQSHCEAYEDESLTKILLQVPEDIRSTFSDMLSKGETRRNNPTSW